MKKQVGWFVWELKEKSREKQSKQFEKQMREEKEKDNRM